MRLVRLGVGMGALCVGAVGAVACDSLLGEEDRFFVLDDASDAQREPARDGAVSGGAEGGGDGSRGDARDDAAADDASEGDGDGGDDAGAFCASAPPHYICSDFDEGALYFDYSDAGAQWTANVFGVGASQIATTTGSLAPVSPPAALLSELTGPDGGITGTGGGGSLALTLPTDLTSLQLDLELLLPEQTTSQGAADLFSLVQGDTGGNDYGTFVQVGTGGLTLMNLVAAENGTETTTRALPQLAPGWQHVRLVMQRAAAGHLTLSFGGTVVLDQDLRTLSADTQHFILYVGLNSFASTSVLNAFYDNVTFDFTE